MTRKRNLAARAGRWSAQHRKKAIFGWLTFVILAVFIGGSVGTRTLTDEEYGHRRVRPRRQGRERDAFPERGGTSPSSSRARKGVEPGRPGLQGRGGRR